VTSPPPWREVTSFLIARHQLKTIERAAQRRMQIASHLLRKALRQQARYLFSDLIDESGGRHGATCDGVIAASIPPAPCTGMLHKRSA